MIAKTITAAEFFRAHAGYSWNPATETEDQGRARCARELAAAELEGTAAGLTIAWTWDDITSADHDTADDEDPYPLWVATAHDADGNILASLGGVDLGADGRPCSHPYARVVRAELFAEALTPPF